MDGHNRILQDCKWMKCRGESNEKLLEAPIIGVNGTFGKNIRLDPIFDL